jgi:mono/diheme cytochrome c family protein
MSAAVTAPVVATITQLGIGLALVAAALVAWVIYIIRHLNRDPVPASMAIELAPNRRPYLDDEEMEGRRLEQVQKAGLVALVIVALGLPVYWAREPGRQQGAIKEFNQIAVNRGFSLFQPSDSPLHGAHFGCAGCHGSVGQGGAAKFTITDYLGRQRQVQWTAPALNTVMKRFTPDEVTQILVYGRANTPMPAWGVAGGGPMNDQQISDLVAYLGSIQLSDKDAMKQSLELAQLVAKQENKSNVDGQILFKAMCARCHTIGWSYGEPQLMGGGAFGPNLTNGDTIRQFPNVADQVDFITNGSEIGKPYGVRGIGHPIGGGMPGFGTSLTEDQIKQIVDYERSL